MSTEGLPLPSSTQQAQPSSVIAHIANDHGWPCLASKFWGAQAKLDYSGCSYCNISWVLLQIKTLHTNIGLPLHLVLSEILSHFPWEMVKTMKCGSMKKSISRFPEYSRNFVVIICHQLGLWWFFGQWEKSMYIFHCFEGFLKGGKLHITPVVAAESKKWEDTSLQKSKHV